jgi:hypothetical protein
VHSKRWTGCSKVNQKGGFLKFGSYL